MERCDHPKLEPPEFDYEAAKNLDEYEIRKRWPRKTEVCPDCGDMVILYASAEHYTMGDW